MMNSNTNRATKLITILLLLTLVISGCTIPVAPATGGASEAAEASSTTGEAQAEDAAEITITHAQGETVVPKNPATVVVFDLSTLDTLDQWGVDVAAVPQSSVIPPFLAKYSGEAYVNAGTLFEPDYEAVNALDPDLIIVASRSSAVYEELAKIAPTIDLTVDQSDLLASFNAQTTTLATIFGKEAEAADALAALDESIARVQEQAAAGGQKALIVMTSGGEVTAYGPGSRFGLIHDLLQVSPVVEDIEAATHGDAISFEFILEYDPEILYIIDRDSAIGQDGEAAAQVMDNELIHATQAWENDKLIYLNGAAWYLASSGLGTFASMVAEIESSLGE